METPVTTSPSNSPDRATDRHERGDRPDGVPTASGPLDPADPRPGRHHPARWPPGPGRTHPGRAQRGQDHRARRAAQGGALEHRPRRGAGRPVGGHRLRCVDDQPARGDPAHRDRRRQARLHREADGRDPGRGGRTGPAGPGRRHHRRCRPRQAVPARPGQAPPSGGRGLLRPDPVVAGRVRLLGLRGRRPVGAAAVLELPQGRRRRHDHRHVLPLELRARGHPRAGPLGRRDRGHPHPDPLGRERPAVRRDRGRRLVRDLRVRDPAG